MLRNKKAILAGLGLACGLTYAGCHYDDKPGVEGDLDKIVRQYLKGTGKKEDITAISVSVFVPKQKQGLDGNLYNLYKGNRGLDELAVPVRADSLYEIGSITKSYIAVLLQQLALEGRLSLDEPIGKFFPEYPNWASVTPRQLLNMTSGIPNYTESDDMAKAEKDSDYKKRWTEQELLAFAEPDKALAFTPGSKYYYSNSNYLLAGLIIEKLYDKPLDLILQERIFTPLAMQNSYYPVGLQANEITKTIAPRKVHGYVYDEDSKKLEDISDNDLSWAMGAGAIVANTEDVFKWVKALYTGSLYPKEQRAQALGELKSVVSIKSGAPIQDVSKAEPAGFGLGVGYAYVPELETRFWTYEGSSIGYRVMYLWNDCNHVATVVALNSKAGASGGAHGENVGDGISGVSFELYKAVLKRYPALRCNTL